jgi:hypothetical protein
VTVRAFFSWYNHERQLDVLAGILTHIEREQVTSPRLAGFRTQLTTGRLLPSFAPG